MLSNNQIQDFWNANPFPHLVIDNFIDQSVFDNLTNSLNEQQQPPVKTFKTSVEKNKEVFDNNNISSELKNFVELITNQDFLHYYIRPLTNIATARITPLTNFKNHDYKFHHKMTGGGYLGTHVDHSYLDSAPGQFHFLNCIFYAHKEWQSKWGGETTLCDKYLVEPSPNRLLIFLHTSHSWHGVNNISHWATPRQTIYMDYYAPTTELGTLQQKYLHTRHQLNIPYPEIWKHRTTFKPKWLSLDSWRYWHPYLTYLLRRPL